MKVSRSGFYAWTNRGPSLQERSNQALWLLIRALITQAKEAIGYRQVYKQLRNMHILVSINRVQRLLQKARYRAIMARKPRRNKAVMSQLALLIGNLLNRQFDVERANQVWVSDITQIDCQEGWLYVCIILDLYSRAVIGFSLGTQADTGLVLDALQEARQVSQLSRLDGLLFHSDQGVQYRSEAVQSWLNRQGATLSYSRKGNCWDNACSESFFSLMKQQWITPAGCLTRKSMSQLVTEYIQQFYNTWRVHGTTNEVPMDRYLMAM